MTKLLPGALIALIVPLALPGAALAEPEPSESVPALVSVPPAESPLVSEPPATVAEPEAAAPGESPPPLDQLIRLPAPAETAPGDAKGVDWARERDEAKPEQKRKQRLRLDYSSENLTEGVPMQDERNRTDVGVSVPVDPNEKLRVKGGVRVNERKGSETERDADTTPTVGVEVKF
jgi:hypothetical protein